MAVGPLDAPRHGPVAHVEHGDPTRAVRAQLEAVAAGRCCRVVVANAVEQLVQNLLLLVPLLGLVAGDRQGLGILCIAVAFVEDVVKGGVDVSDVLGGEAGIECAGGRQIGSGLGGRSGSGGLLVLGAETHHNRPIVVIVVQAEGHGGGHLHVAALDAQEAQRREGPLDAALQRPHPVAHRRVHHGPPHNLCQRPLATLVKVVVEVRRLIRVSHASHRQRLRVGRHGRPTTTPTSHASRCRDVHHAPSCPSTIPRRPCPQVASAILFELLCQSAAGLCHWLVRTGVSDATRPTADRAKHGAGVLLLLLLV
mmetsp:Transcript_16890/g.48139  ORF Transcript_16890/g.48139 Transcript_16890/m.48139 type:complete len:310 (-) Transcript_16890:370-1299(-)